MPIQKRWQKFTVLNIGIALGVFTSLFWIPKSTSVVLLVVLFGAVIAVMNYLLFTRLKRISSGESTKDTSLSTIVVVVGFLIFLLDLVFRVVRHSP